MMELIGINTTRYSALLKRILKEFNRDVEITIGMETYLPGKFQYYSEDDIPELLAEWCTNNILKKTTFFNLKMNDEELFGWWDHPSHMWADISVLPFVEKLSNEKIIRYHIAIQKDSKIVGWLKKVFRFKEKK